LSQWSSAKAKVVLRALQRIGWIIISQKGSHTKLHHAERGRYTFAFHDSDEIGPHMLARIAKHTGLTPHDL
jgi:predicted RNA binding protein YcfA (HicA-like mRNA interferase family)